MIRQIGLPKKIVNCAMFIAFLNTQAVAAPIQYTVDFTADNFTTFAPFGSPAGVPSDDPVTGSVTLTLDLAEASFQGRRLPEM